MLREKIFRGMVIFYVIILFFTIGLIINKFTARQHQLVAPVVSIQTQTEKITTETVVKHIYQWMEMDVERSRSIIAESIPTMNGGQVDGGLMEEITQPKNWLKGFTDWILGIDLKNPDTYLTSSIPHLDSYNQAHDVLATTKGEENIDKASQNAQYTAPRVIKGEKGNIYLNVPREQLLNYPKPDLGIKPQDPPEILPDPDPSEMVEIVKRVPRILIYHTHTTETYIDDTRPQDISYHVLYPEIGKIVDVGKVLADNLRDKGFLVYHDTTDFVGENFGECYNNARAALLKLFKEQSFDIVIDLHRDGVDNSVVLERDNYSVEIAGKTAAQIMYLYTQGILEYSDQKWDPNKEFCSALNVLTNELYPGLSRGIALRTGRRYNLDLHPHSVLIEVGFQKSTTTEAAYTTLLLADVIEKLFKEQPVFLLDKRSNE